MIDDASIAWTALLVLGAVHGINPAMGWLFAVSLGLQERRRRAVWRALGPLALGHAGAVAAALAVAVAAGRVLPLEPLKWTVAVLLVGLGVLQLLRHRHPRGGGMTVGAREMAGWSFLMATAHGAGLMAVPFVLGPGAAGAGGGHGVHHPAVAAASAGWTAGLAGGAVHALGYLLVTGLVAALVYEWVGLRLLRKIWINLDLLWAATLIVTGLLTPLL